MRPALAPAGCCAASIAGSSESSESRTSNLRMGPRLHRKKRQRIGFEDSLVLLVRKRQGQELIDVLPEVLHTGAGPVGPPQHPISDLRQAGKVLQQFRRRNARDIQPDFPMTSQDEKR